MWLPVLAAARATGPLDLGPFRASDRTLGQQRCRCLELLSRSLAGKQIVLLVGLYTADWVGIV